MKVDFEKKRLEGEIAQLSQKVNSENNDVKKLFEVLNERKNEIEVLQREVKAN